MPELQGRFPIRVELDDLTREDFLRILTEPENALTKQHVALMATEGVSLTFTDDAERAYLNMAARTGNMIITSGHTSTQKGKLGDDVTVELTPYDLSKGRITYRSR